MKQSEILHCLFRLVSDNTLAGFSLNRHQWTPSQGSYVQEDISKVLATCRKNHQWWIEGLPLRGVTGLFLKMRQASGTSCHLNKLLFWIQLWWQLQCQVATERNIVLFFWWARPFEVSKLILWDLLSKAGLRKNCQARSDFFALTPTPSPQEPSFPTTFPASSGISLAADGSTFLFLLGLMSPFFLYSNDFTQEQVFLGEDTIGILVEN